MTPEYGALGCRCWCETDNWWDDRCEEIWYPNASCPHHGVHFNPDPTSKETRERPGILSAFKRLLRARADGYRAR